MNGKLVYAESKFAIEYDNINFPLVLEQSKLCGVFFFIFPSIDMGWDVNGWDVNTAI